MKTKTKQPTSKKGVVKKPIKKVVIDTKKVSPKTKKVSPKTKKITSKTKKTNHILKKIIVPTVKKKPTVKKTPTVKKVIIVKKTPTVIVDKPSMKAIKFDILVNTNFKKEIPRPRCNPPKSLLKFIKGDKSKPFTAYFVPLVLKEKQSLNTDAILTQISEVLVDSKINDKSVDDSKVDDSKYEIIVDKTKTKYSHKNILVYLEKHPFSTLEQIQDSLLNNPGTVIPSLSLALSLNQIKYEVRKINGIEHKFYSR